VSDSDRFHRDDPKRAHPRRNMSEGLRSDDPWSVRPEPGRPGQFRDAGASGEESVSNGVDDAYRVADEHMREGQWRAGSRNQRSYDWRSPGYGAPFGYGYGGRSPDGLLEQVMRVYLDMMSLAGTMMNGLARPPYPPQYPPPYPRPPFEGRREPEYHYAPDPAPRARSAGVRVEVSSSQPNYVALDLKPLRPGVSLAVPPLRALNNKLSELRDIEFDSSNDHYVFRVRIPDAQPPGLYSGVVVDSRTGEPCGTLAVQVGRQEEQTKPHPAKHQG
jgi:hypothetical protein